VCRDHHDLDAAPVRPQIRLAGGTFETVVALGFAANHLVTAASQTLADEIAAPASAVARHARPGDALLDRTSVATALMPVMKLS
jgi:hypothetical protein